MDSFVHHNFDADSIPENTISINWYSPVNIGFIFTSSLSYQITVDGFYVLICAPYAYQRPPQFSIGPSVEDALGTLTYITAWYSYAKSGNSYLNSGMYHFLSKLENGIRYIYKSASSKYSTAFIASGELYESSSKHNVKLVRYPLIE